jgi:hypothetical protein
MLDRFTSIPDILLLAAGIAMLAHVVLSRAAVRSLADYPSVLTDLFAVPNQPLGTPEGFRLMRVRYFWPFRALPEAARSLDPGIQRLLQATRQAGFCFACAMLGYLGTLFIEASR